MIVWRWRLAPRNCSHPEWRVECIHGDEILTSGMRRGWCHECHVYVNWLPYRCWVTGEPHPAKVRP